MSSAIQAVSAPDFAAGLAALPPAPQVTSADIREAIAASGRVVVAIDDDPTGTQSVAGVPLVSRWSLGDLRWGLTRGAPCLFVLANTRSLGPEEAEQRGREIVRSVDRASRLERVPYVLLSRSDSTLRGHFPLEVDVIDDELRSLTGRGADGVIFCPAYVEAGRVTFDDVQWAREGGQMVPVADTPYARDSSFGYSSSNLRDFVSERSAGRIGADEVMSIGLEEIRTSISAIVDRLRAARDGQVIVVNAVCDEDLRAAALAIIQAEALGKRFVYRTGPSFVRARSGLDAPKPLSPGAGLPKPGERVAPGLIVVGSHVPLSTRQLDRLRRLTRVEAIEVPVAEVLSRADRAELSRGLAVQATAALADRNVVLYTSREVSAPAGTDPLDAARQVSSFLVDLTRRIIGAGRPGFIVAKGGITSSDLATEALGIYHAWVDGPLFPGQVSMWRAEDGPASRIPFVVFPGNVGDDDSLAAAVERLEGETGC